MENLFDVGNSTTGFNFFTKHFDFGDTDIGVENPCLEIDDFFCFEFFLQLAFIIEISTHVVVSLLLNVGYGYLPI